MSSLTKVKSFEELNFKHWKALATRCGGISNVLDILRGNKMILLRDPPSRFFDHAGRRIPDSGLKLLACEPSRMYIYDTISYAGAFERFKNYFPNSPNISLIAKANELTNELKRSNVLKGLCLPICLPPLPKRFDYGDLLEKEFLPMIRNCYISQKSGNMFNNCFHEPSLKGRVTIDEDSGHEWVVEEMISNGRRGGLTAALFFPHALNGFSVTACRQQMMTLPPGFALAGGFDSIVAMLMYPDILTKRGGELNPVLVLAALNLDANDALYFLTTYGNDILRFGHLRDPESGQNQSSLAETHTAGLLYLGS